MNNEDAYGHNKLWNFKINQSIFNNIVITSCITEHPYEQGTGSYGGCKVRCILLLRGCTMTPAFKNQKILKVEIWFIVGASMFFTSSPCLGQSLSRDKMKNFLLNALSIISIDQIFKFGGEREHFLVRQLEESHHEGGRSGKRHSSNKAKSEEYGVLKQGSSQLVSPGWLVERVMKCERSR